jgi:5-methylcytosine-specific restriction endonuclease McrA
MQSGEECPTCGEIYADDHGIKVHHKLTHGESLAKETLTCEQCGEEFSEFQSRIERRKGVYCSKECKYSQGQIKTECDWCGESVTKSKNRAERYSNHYCSKNCYQKHYTERVSETSEHPSYQGGPETVECDNCSKELELYCHRLTDHNFCSIECRTELFQGETHPDFEHRDNRYYGSDWASYRIDALLEWEGRCASCGLTEPTHIRTYGKSLDIHHEPPVEVFDDIETAHEEAELQPVCIKCHSKVENGEVAL